MAKTTAPDPDDDRDGYEKYKEKQAAISRERSAEGREIGKLPPVKNRKRRKRCEGSLRAFCEAYFPNRFPLAWSADHLAAIERIERCVHVGGQYGYAMARGSGKTTLAEVGAMYATFNGHRRFVMLVGATESHATGLLESIKAEVESNDVLAEDYPEVCFPVRALDGIHNRANGQTLNGERTRIKWTSDKIVLPTVKGKKSSGAVIRVAGITGAIRGAKHTGADGKPIRPDLAILDDPQTDESAKSPSQNATREAVISKAVLGLAGPKKKIAVVMPCTIIVPGDLADRFLDRTRHPSWQGERSAMVVSWPTNQSLWDRYAELRRDGLRAGDEGKAATEFYREHRAEMDEGAVVGWAERFNEDELSAIQNAWNLRIDRGDAAFMAEYQNDPMPLDPEEASALDADELSRRSTNLARGVVQRTCSRVVAFIDVGAHLLWYAVAALDERFGGSIIAYGAFPDQTRAYFSANDPRPSLADVAARAGKHGPEAAIYHGLSTLAAKVLGSGYRQEETGGVFHVEKCLVDANWGPATKLVYDFCRRAHSVCPGVRPGVLVPSHGKFYGASSNGLTQATQRPTDVRRGDGWVLTDHTVGHGQHVVFDANYVKTFTADRLRTPEGAAGCLKFHAAGPSGHQLLADHLTAEYPVTVTRQSGGRTVEEWKDKPNRDNHLWDCVVGCIVSAGVAGLKWDSGAAAGVPPPPKKPREKLKMSELFARKNGGGR